MQRQLDNISTMGAALSKEKPGLSTRKGGVQYLIKILRKLKIKFWAE